MTKKGETMRDLKKPFYDEETHQKTGQKAMKAIIENEIDSRIKDLDEESKAKIKEFVRLVHSIKPKYIEFAEDEKGLWNKRREHYFTVRVRNTCDDCRHPFYNVFSICLHTKESVKAVKELLHEFWILNISVFNESPDYSEYE